MTYRPFSAIGTADSGLFYVHEEQQR
jgi:hypothetical protein